MNVLGEPEDMDDVGTERDQDVQKMGHDAQEQVGPDKTHVKLGPPVLHHAPGNYL